MKLTNEQIKRTKDALHETEGLLVRELSYSEHLQNKEQIKFYRGHILKLKSMLLKAGAQVPAPNTEAPKNNIRWAVYATGDAEKYEVKRHEQMPANCPWPSYILVGPFICVETAYFAKDCLAAGMNANEIEKVTPVYEARYRKTCEGFAETIETILAKVKEQKAAGV